MIHVMILIKLEFENFFQPGRKNLLLNSLFDKNKEQQKESVRKNINKSGKRKDLPVGERIRLEKQQNDAVAAYRLLKSRKQRL